MSGILLVLVIARTHLIGHICGDRFQLSHELIANPCVILNVSKAAHMSLAINTNRKVTYRIHVVSKVAC